MKAVEIISLSTMLSFYYFYVIYTIDIVHGTSKHLQIHVNILYMLYVNIIFTIYTINNKVYIWKYLHLLYIFFM